VIKKTGFRYRQAETAGVAAVERLERTAGLASAVRWLRNAHVAERFGVEKPTQKLRSFFSQWSIQFSAEYYEAKERQAAEIPSPDSGKLRTQRLSSISRGRWPYRDSAFLETAGSVADAGRKNAAAPDLVTLPRRSTSG
jgi:hypothetical protein